MSTTWSAASEACPALADTGPSDLVVTALVGLALVAAGLLVLRVARGRGVLAAAAIGLAVLAVGVGADQAQAADTCVTSSGTDPSPTGPAVVVPVDRPTATSSPTRAPTRVPTTTPTPTASVPGALRGTLTATGVVDIDRPPNGPPAPPFPWPLTEPQYTTVDGPLADTVVDLLGAGPDGVFGTGDDTEASTRTGPDGTYAFPELAPGRYRVSVEPLSGPVGSWFWGTQDSSCEFASTGEWDVVPAVPAAGVVTSGSTAVVDIAQTSSGNRACRSQ